MRCVKLGSCRRDHHNGSLIVSLEFILTHLWTSQDIPLFNVLTDVTVTLKNRSLIPIIYGINMPNANLRMQSCVHCSVHVLVVLFVYK